VRVAVRLTPNARRAGVQGIGDAPGGRAVKASVTVAPEGGKANAALIKMLAKLWGVPKSAIEIASGATDRNKSLLLRGDPEILMPRLRDWARDADGMNEGRNDG
jgi:uncharacterized protein YggU (UPF0235/DUF167 family)